MNLCISCIFCTPTSSGPIRWTGVGFLQTRFEQPHQPKDNLMSTNYRPLSPIYIDDLLDGRMKNVCVHERSGLEYSPLEKCVTDGRNFLWAYFDVEGLVTSFTSYMPNG